MTSTKRIFTRIGLAAPALVLALGVVIAAPVFAERADPGSSEPSAASSGSGGSTSGDDGQSTVVSSDSGDSAAPDASADDSSSSDATQMVTGTAQDTSVGGVESKARRQGAELYRTLRAERKVERSTKARKQLCEAHKQGLTNKFKHINEAMTGFKTRIDTIFARVQEYQSSNNVTVANWDSLVAAAQSAQSTSANSNAVLKAVTPSLDCNSTSVVSDVATFKVAAQTARDDLKAYKKAVKAVVQALLAAKNTTNEGENN